MTVENAGLLLTKSPNVLASFWPHKIIKPTTDDVLFGVLEDIRSLVVEVYMDSPATIRAIDLFNEFCPEKMPLAEKLSIYILQDLGAEEVFDLSFAVSKRPSGISYSVSYRGANLITELMYYIIELAVFIDDPKNSILPDYLDV